MKNDKSLTKDLAGIRAAKQKWADENPLEAKLSVVCTHILFPPDGEPTKAIRMKFGSMTEEQAKLTSGFMYLCDGCALLFDNTQLNPALSGNYQLIKWKDFRKNISSIKDR